jgi:hypothetical protein
MMTAAATHNGEWRQRRDCDIHLLDKDPGIMILASGVRRAVNYCILCNQTFDLGVKLPRDNDHLPIVRDNRNHDRVCAVCGEVGAEYHHWAPRSLFADADSWPISLLCPTHHRQWHTTMRAFEKEDVA